MALNCFGQNRMSELYHKVIQKPWGRSKADRRIYSHPEFDLRLWCSALPENEIDKGCVTQQ
jgi:hypothetical protein